MMLKRVIFAVLFAMLLVACGQTEAVPTAILPVPAIATTEATLLPATAVTDNPTALPVNTNTAVPPATATTQPAANVPTATQPVAATAVPLPMPVVYTNQTTPPDLLASYYNAINRQEYGRAYTYWNVAPFGQTETQFANGFADTRNVQVAIGLPYLYEGAAGSQYASLPTFLQATHSNSAPTYFIGCFVTRRTTPGISDDPQAALWHIQEATFAPTTDLNPAQLQTACKDTLPADFVYDNVSEAALLLGSYYDAINRQDYSRAYNYWRTPPQGSSFEAFRDGFAQTTAVQVVVKLPLAEEGAAGTIYATLPTLLIANENGRSQTYVGYFVAQRSNVEPASMDWSLSSADIVPATLNLAQFLARN